MLIKFESEQSGSFVMFSDKAVPLLKMMGASGAPEGAVSDAELDASLARLENRLREEARQPADEQTDRRAEEEGDDVEDDEDRYVDLSTRAAPLLDMMRKAKAGNGYVMWRPEE
jgi:hypothetical protein